MKTLKTTLLTAIIATSAITGLTQTASAKLSTEDVTTQTDPTELMTKASVETVEQVSYGYYYYPQSSHDYYINCVIWERC